MMESMYNDLSVLFPARYVHMGGDEVLHSCWNNTQINRFMADNNIPDYYALQ